jgi:hypothetical protein
MRPIRSARRGLRRRAPRRPGVRRGWPRPAPSVAALLVACVIVVLCASCGGHPQTRVLFIGNSFTFYNGGIDAELTRLEPSCVTSSVTAGGATLQQQWDTGQALRAIRSGHWDYVVLQEQSQTPVIAQPLFRDYAARFDRAITASGATTVLLMTWQRPDSAAEGVTTANLAAAYRGVAARLGARVAPAGEAFAEALLERPGLVLNNLDGHPTVEGTYLAACVVYETILGRSPVGIAYSDGGISPELRLFLQRVAGESAVGR